MEEYVFSHDSNIWIDPVRESEPLPRYSYHILTEVMGHHYQRTGDSPLVRVVSEDLGVKG